MDLISDGPPAALHSSLAVMQGECAAHLPDRLFGIVTAECRAGRLNLGDGQRSLEHQSNRSNWDQPWHNRPPSILANGRRLRGLGTPALIACLVLRSCLISASRSVRVRSSRSMLSNSRWVESFKK